MQWLTQHADAISTIAIISGFLWWVRSSLSKLIQNQEKKIEEIQKDIKSIDQRLNKLEGRFEERGYWESRFDNRGQERQRESIQTVPLIEVKRRRNRRKQSTDNQST